MSFLIAETLQSLMARAGWSSHELARRSGIKQPIIHRLLSGDSTNPTLATIEPIARSLNVSISQLLGEDSFTKKYEGRNSKNQEEWEAVPFVNQDGLGDLSFSIENSTKWVMVDCQFSNKAFAVKVNDKNMDPAIPENATIVIEPLLQPENRDFVFTLCNKKFHVKCYIKKGSNQFLLPWINNPDTIEEFSKSEETIIGTVVRVIYGRKTTQTI